MLTAIVLFAASVLPAGAAPAVADDELPPCCAAAAQEAADDEQSSADESSTDANHDDVNALLNELESAAGDLRAFTADVVYINEEALLGRRETRTGNLIYQVDDVTGDKSFAILFDSLVVGTTRRNREKHYVFSDGWLAEIDHESKQFINRQIVQPGQSFDPLKLGEGPIPLPIGQPKDDVLARFDVTTVDVPDDGPLANLNNVDGLRLDPKDGTEEAEEYQQVDLFYDRTTRLPVGIIAVLTNDNRKIVRLQSVQHNPKLTDEQKQRLSIETPDPDEWAIDVRPWRRNR